MHNEKDQRLYYWFFHIIALSIEEILVFFRQQIILFAGVDWGDGALDDLPIDIRHHPFPELTITSNLSYIFEVVMKDYKNQPVNMNNYHLTKIKQHFRNSRIIIIGDYNVMLAAHNMLKIKSFKLNRVLNVCECSFNSEVLNILDLHLVNMNEFHPGRVQSQGPFPPDTMFLQALNGKFDVVVAMYHDQGHIPLKLVGFNSGVNVTVGLPFIRTSVDHGTAFEIAWQGTANEGIMVEAIKLSIKLVQ